MKFGYVYVGVSIAIVAIGILIFSEFNYTKEQQIWFKYTPICCGGAPWDNEYTNSTSLSSESLKIKYYFKNHGITIIESMWTNNNCTFCPAERYGSPLYYSYYFLVYQSDENKMLNFGYSKVDTIPSNAHPIGK